MILPVSYYRWLKLLAAQMTFKFPLNNFDLFNLSNASVRKVIKKIFKTYWMDTFNVSVEFSAGFKKFFTVLAPIFFLLYFIGREVKASMILCSLDWRKSLLANGTLFALRMTLVNMDGNLAETRHGSGTQLAKTRDSSFLMNRKNLFKTIWHNEWISLLWTDQESSHHLHTPLQKP